MQGEFSMKIEQKQWLTYFFVIFTIFLQIFILTGCQNKSEDQLLKEKGVQEIKYLDSKLIGMLNHLNGISFENYMVVSEQIGSSDGTESSESSQSSPKGEEDSEEKSQSSDSTESSSQSDAQKESNNSQKASKMQPNNILNRNSEEKIDWNTLKLDIENLASEWNTMLLDLYKLNVDNNKILEFSKSLDSAMMAIKEENKKESVVQLGNLYRFIPEYLNQFSEQTSFNNIESIKANLINAYVLIEEDKWNEINGQLESAESEYTSNIINDTNLLKDHSYSVNKAYVMLKELKNSTGTKDKEIFYIKYKNLMEELNLFNQ